MSQLIYNRSLILLLIFIFDEEGTDIDKRYLSLLKSCLKGLDHNLMVDGNYKANPVLQQDVDHFNYLVKFCQPCALVDRSKLRYEFFSLFHVHS